MKLTYMKEFRKRISIVDLQNKLLIKSYFLNQIGIKYLFKKKKKTFFNELIRWGQKRHLRSFAVAPRNKTRRLRTGIRSSARDTDFEPTFLIF